MSGIEVYFYALPVILTAGLFLISGKTIYRSALREMKEDGMWFIALIPLINWLMLGTIIWEFCIGDVKFHPRFKDSVYFLPLLSLGLLYFI